MMLILSLISLVVIPSINAEDIVVKEDANCTTPNETQGICINIKSCRPLFPLVWFPRDSVENKFLRKSKCGGYYAEVCCPIERKRNSTINLSNQNSIPMEDANCTTPNGTVGICINLKSCQPLLPLLSFPQDSEEIKFLKRSKCGGYYADVCCPIEKKRNQTINQSIESLVPNGVCGKTNVGQRRIVGGTEADLGAWPWIAVLGYKVNYASSMYIEWLCGGSLINDRYVLTAAHCIRLKKELFLKKVRLGEHDLGSNSDDANPVDYGIEKFIVHEEYSSHHNDIALIRLDKNVNFTDKIKPICLPQLASLRSSTFERKYIFLAGWGETRFNGFSSDILLQVQVPVVDNDSCKTAYAKYGVFITDRQICAGDKKGGKDSCLGDSGGPLMFSEGGVYYQIGIISFGYLCAAPGYPGVNTRVTSYLDWISNNIV